MHKEKIEKIINEYKLINLQNELYIKKIINNLSRCDRGEYIYPCNDMYWLFKEDKDFVYAVLDALEKEKYLTSN